MLQLSMDGIFCVGQAYVALSRCRSLKGLQVEGFTAACVKAEPKVKRFYECLRKCELARIKNISFSPKGTLLPARCNFAAPKRRQESGDEECCEKEKVLRSKRSRAASPSEMNKGDEVMPPATSVGSDAV